MIPVLIDNVKPPLGFGTIQAADLISWEPTQSSPEFEKLIADISAILGHSPIEVKESERSAEVERKRDQEKERRRKETEAERKDREHRKRKEAQDKRNAEEERKRKEQKKYKARVHRAKEETKAKPVVEESPIIGPKAPNKKRTAFGIGIVVLIVVLSLFAVFYYKNKFSPKMNIPSVEAMKVGQNVKFEHIELKFPSRVMAFKEISISFQIRGRLISLPITEGGKVEKGQIVAQLDNKIIKRKSHELQSQLEKANAELIRAEADYERVKRIQKADPGAVSKALIDRMLKAFDASRRRTKELSSKLIVIELNLDRFNLRAPFNGVIVERFVENFQEVKPKQPIVAIQDLSKIRLIVNIPESMIDYVKDYKIFWVHISAIPNKLIAIINQISAEPDEATRTYSVTLLVEKIPDINILPGMMATVNIIMGVHGIKINRAAVLISDDKKSNNVWVIDQKLNTVSMRKVEIMEGHGQSIIITGGLNPGELVVTKNVELLQDGKSVEIHSIIDK